MWETWFLHSAELRRFQNGCVFSSSLFYPSLDALRKKIIFVSFWSSWIKQRLLYAQTNARSCYFYIIYHSWLIWNMQSALQLPPLFASFLGLSFWIMSLHQSATDSPNYSFLYSLATKAQDLQIWKVLVWGRVPIDGCKSPAESLSRCWKVLIRNSGSVLHSFILAFKT